MVFTLTVFVAAPTLGTHRNCPDFETHAQAQRYFENADHPTSDLDADDDGDACEGLPGYDAGGGNGGGNDGPGELPESATRTGDPASGLPLLLAGLGLGTFWLMLRRRFGIRP
jgi:hypothetical protein